MKINYDFDYTCFVPKFFSHGRPEGVSVHRIKPAAPFASDAAGVRDFYQKHADLKSFEGTMPFHFVIDAQGNTTQTVPLDRQTPHARSFNGTHAAIGCIGDFRTEVMPAAQLSVLVGLVANLAHSAGFPIGKPGVLGHSEGGDSTLDSPGKRLCMDDVRGQAQATLAQLQRGKATKAELVWTSRCTRHTLA